MMPLKNCHSEEEIKGCVKEGISKYIHKHFYRDILVYNERFKVDQILVLNNIKGLQNILVEAKYRSNYNTLCDQSRSISQVCKYYSANPDLINSAPIFMCISDQNAVLGYAEHLKPFLNHPQLVNCSAASKVYTSCPDFVSVLNNSIETGKIILEIVELQNCDSTEDNNKDYFETLVQKIIIMLSVLSSGSVQPQIMTNVNSNTLYEYFPRYVFINCMKSKGAPPPGKSTLTMMEYKPPRNRKSIHGNPDKRGTCYKINKDSLVSRTISHCRDGYNNAAVAKRKDMSTRWKILQENDYFELVEENGVVYNKLKKDLVIDPMCLDSTGIIKHVQIKSISLASEIVSGAYVHSTGVDWRNNKGETPQEISKLVIDQQIQLQMWKDPDPLKF